LRRAGGWSAATAMLAVVAACGGSGGGSGASATGVGTLKLALTDAPACGFDQVNVTIEKIRLHRDASAGENAPGWQEIPLPSTRVDLLALTNGALRELGATALPAGRYTQMRLVLADAPGSMVHSVRPTGGAEVPLALPGGPQGAVTLPGHLDVVPGQTADLVLDFDACRSVVQAGAPGGYHLKPAIAALPRLASGIEGVVAGALVSPGTVVSAQKDGASVRATRPDERGRFSIPFLAPGTYTLVIAADGHATGVVTGVPVGAGATAVGSAAEPIALPASAMGELSGNLSGTVEPDGTDALTSASRVEVRASQQLADGASIELRSLPLDGVVGNWQMKLPSAAPVKAAYSAAGNLSFSADAFEAGQYSLDVLLRPDPSQPAS
jgi:hypothetical protein